jgi:peroxiredoxin Q/BCP
MLSVGDTAPDFELLDDTGNPVKLSDFRGQRVVLFFYPKAATPGCTTQACGFRDNYFVLEAKDTAVIGLSPDPPKALAKWKAKENLPYTLVSDPDHTTAEAYGVWGEKKMYGKSYMGIIRSHVIIGPDGTIEDVQLGVSPKDSVDKAMAFLAN